MRYPILTLNPKIPTISQNCGLFLAMRARHSRQERQPAPCSAHTPDQRKWLLFEAWWKSVIK